MNSYLGIDIGAGSGRHILGELKQGKIVLTEVYRFENGIKEKNNHLCWDIPSLYSHVVAGIKECVKHYTIPSSIGIDTWGVDFVLLDEENNIVGDTVAYRDSRTDGMDTEVEKILPFSELYGRTGIQKMLLNSIYQLMAIKLGNPHELEKAKHLLMIPDYLNFLLTGEMTTEYTNASTTSLVDVKNKDWDYELIDLLGFPKHIFSKITVPGTSLGKLKDSITKEVGADIEVLLVPTHDTASAFVAIPSKGDDSVFISSGTWSLLGIESKDPIVTPEGMEANFTNEGGYEYRYRYLKNYMGLWMLQSVRRDLGNKYSYPELAEMGRKGEGYPLTVDVNDSIFVAPKNMIEAVKVVLQRENKPLPKTLEETLFCVYHSIALSYMVGIKNLERIVKKEFNEINIVGGGCQDSFLNELTAAVTNLKVTAGPIEATAIGNIVVQMIAKKEISDLQEARRIIKESFEVKEY